jgi:glutathione S-transferase
VSDKLTLISFDLCPYVQRAAIALAEKGVTFERIDIDLANKPDWFLEISPQGKVPVLKIGDRVLFESSPIVEYLDETYAPRLHPDDPAERARHRAWMEFGSSMLSDLWAIQTATDYAVFDRAAASLREKFGKLERELGQGPYFAGAKFSIVDAVFAPVFRYFEVLDGLIDLDVMNGLPKVAQWRADLATRPSVRAAVPADYAERLRQFLRERNGVLGRARLAA